MNKITVITIITFVLLLTIGGVVKYDVITNSTHIAFGAGGDITSNLLGWWKFDEGTGTTAADSSGNGNNGTFTGSPTWVAGQVGTGALSFSVGARILTNDLTATEGVSAVTWSAWIKPTSLGDLRAILAKFYKGTASGHQQFILEESNGTFGDNSGLIAAVSSTNGTGNDFVYTGSVLTTGVWTHVAVVFDGSLTGNTNRLKVYINGTQVSTTGTGSIPSTTQTTTSDFSIGASSDNIANFIGAIDDVRVYNRALSSTDVADLYAYTEAPPVTTPAVGNTVIFFQ